MHIKYRSHSMAKNNLNKGKKVLTSTTTASKYMPKRPRICINWNPPFQTQIYLVKVPLNVNIVKQDLLNKKQFLKILWSEVWKGGFQLIQILGLMDMYFAAVVVEIKTFFYLYSDWLRPCRENGLSSMIISKTIRCYAWLLYCQNLQQFDVLNAIFQHP